MKKTTTAAQDPVTPEPQSIFDILASTFDDLPEEMLNQLPTDGAENHDHYLYGWPKKNEATECTTANAQ